MLIKFLLPAQGETDNALPVGPASSVQLVCKNDGRVKKKWEFSTNNNKKKKKKSVSSFLVCEEGTKRRR